MDNHGAATTTAEIILTNNIFTANFSRTGGDNVWRRQFQGRRGAVGQKTEGEKYFHC